MAITPDFENVKASYKMLGKQQYRAVVKDGNNKPIFMSIYICRNRDISTSIDVSARDLAKDFICYEFRAVGWKRYIDGEYVHEYKTQAPFFEPRVDVYRCFNGSWEVLRDGSTDFTFCAGSFVPKCIKVRALQKESN